MKINSRQILRFLSNTCDGNEKKLIEEKIDLDADFAKRMRILRLLWHSQKKPVPHKELEAMWVRMKTRLESEQDTPFPQVHKRERSHPLLAFRILHQPRLTWRYVGILLFAIAVSVLVFEERIACWLPHKPTLVTWETVKVDYGRRLTIKLGDNTVIIADAGSEIRYPNCFVDHREVYLEGEAYFEVVSDPEHPFYVRANHALVTVMGTKFDVRAWAENPAVTLYVNEGKVVLSKAESKVQSDSVILLCNETGSLPTDGVPVKATMVDGQNYLGWMKNEIRFDNATVAEVLAQLQRWYNYEFVIQDSLILKEHLTVHILETNVEDVLEVISLLTNTKIEKESNRIRIIPKK